MRDMAAKVVQINLFYFIIRMQSKYAHCQSHKHVWSFCDECYWNPTLSMRFASLGFRVDTKLARVSFHIITQYPDQTKSQTLGEFQLPTTY